jgi:DNA-binding CsgD family transcriptional regulator
LISGLPITRLLFIPNPNTLLWLDEVGTQGELVESIQHGTWKPPAPYTSLGGKLTVYWQEGLVIATAVPLQSNPAEARPRLNRRNREILKGLLAGLTTKQIAMRLGLHPRSIFNHIAALKKSYGAGTRAELAGKARDLFR